MNAISGEKCHTAWLVSDMPYERKKELKEIFLGTKETSSNSENPQYPYGDYFVRFGGEDLDAFTDRIYDAVRQFTFPDDNNIPAHLFEL